MNEGKCASSDCVAGRSLRCAGGWLDGNRAKGSDVARHDGQRERASAPEPGTGIGLERGAGRGVGQGLGLVTLNGTSPNRDLVAAVVRPVCHTTPRADDSRLGSGMVRGGPATGGRSAPSRACRERSRCPRLSRADRPSLAMDPLLTSPHPEGRNRGPIGPCGTESDCYR